MKNKATTRDDWKLRKMPKSHSTISVSRHFSEEEVSRIKLGFLPEDMDYKWFIFFEENRLYIHRSWTGYCIYIVHFEKEGQDYLARQIVVNRNPKQYGVVSEDTYDARMAFWIIDIALLGRDTGMPMLPESL